MTIDDITKAVYRKEIKTLAKLTRKDLALVDKYQRTGLMHAVLASDADPKVIATLIKRGADVNAADKNGWTALHFVSQDGKAQLAQLLLNAGAEVDSKDSQGCTPLWRMLISQKAIDVAPVLLRAGANPNAKDNYGSSPKIRAKQTGKTDVLKLFAAAKLKTKTSAKVKSTTKAATSEAVPAKKAKPTAAKAKRS